MRSLRSLLAGCLVLVTFAAWMLAAALAATKPADAASPGGCPRWNVQVWEGCRGLLSQCAAPAGWEPVGAVGWQGAVLLRQCAPR